jgi:hypothetical protein
VIHFAVFSRMVVGWAECERGTKSFPDAESGLEMGGDEQGFISFHTDPLIREAFCSYEN